MKIRQILGAILRLPCIWWYKRTGQFSLLVRRIDVTEVGFSGHVSLVDESIALQEGLLRLNRFERWLAADYIAYERDRRRTAWGQAVHEVTGEMM